MRITTWNVNGLRAWLNKGGLESVQSIDTDVFCLQEIKSRPDQLDEAALARIQALFPSLTWNPAERPGYSGTAIWAKAAAPQTTLGLGIEQYDVEGRVITSRYDDFWLFNIYFPNGQRDLGRVPFKLEFYARLLDLCDDLHAKGQQVILTGDFNTAHTERDIKNARANSGATGFLPEERAWIDKYLAHNFADAFRDLYPDKVEYTWWSFMGNARKNNTGWRLDYYLISSPLYSRVVDVINHTAVMGSDHCPVTLVLRD
jgi:exodeoxyribonuclease-3